jgi:hypothetical protein
VPWCGAAMCRCCDLATNPARLLQLLNPDDGQLTRCNRTNTAARIRYPFSHKYNMFHTNNHETTISILNHTNHIDRMETRRRRLPGDQMLSKSLDYSRMYRSLPAPQMQHPFVRRSLVMDGASHGNVGNERGQNDVNYNDHTDRVGPKLRCV